MSDRKQDQRRASPRVEFRAPVKVLSGDRSRDCWAHSTNLSASGIHISSTESFPVGAELALDIPLPGDAPGDETDAGLAFRCRVVWVQRARRCGMGLEFLDLNVDERTSLRALIEDEDLTSSWTRPVEIWFDGQPMPVSGTATPGKDGIVVGLEMPHLTAQTLVSFRFTDDDSEPEQVGTLEGAHLDMGAVPRLVATVRPDEDADDGLPTAPWAQEPELDVERPVDADETPTPAEPPPLPEEEPLKEMASGEISLPDVAPSPDEDTPAGEEEEARAPRAVEINGELAALVEREPEPGEEQTPEPTPQWEPDPREDEEFAPQPWRRRLSSLDGEGARNVWLWLAAIVMTGLALASMSYTGLFDRLRSRTAAVDSDPLSPGQPLPPPTAPLKLDAAPQPVADAAMPDAAAPDAPPPKPDAPPPKPDAPPPKPDAPPPKPDAPPPKPDLQAVAAAPDSRVPAVKPDAHVPAAAPDLAAATPAVPRWTGKGPNPALIGKSTHLPAFRDIPGGTEVSFPFKGGNGQVKDTPMSEPYGVSLYLAGAKPSHRYGSFRVRGQKLFRLLRVHERSQGLSIRLFFKDKRDLPYTVRLEPGKLILTVKE